MTAGPTAPAAAGPTAAAAETTAGAPAGATPPPTGAARPRMTVSGVVLDSPDAQELAGFYRRLLGWRTSGDEPDWVMLVSPDGGAGLSFQTEPHFVRPMWPAGPGEQQMQVHLDVRVDDLEVAGRFAVQAGAALADHQPQPDVRVYLDPAGHPFCLFT